MRSRAYFDYVNERMGQKIISGFWRPQENFLHVADYKLYNGFPIYSFVEGRRIDDALDEYLYWMGTGGCQAALAFEIMTSPEQVTARAEKGWRVVAHRPPEILRSKWHHGAWSFSGSGSQYITNGPKILVWDSPNRLVGSNGLWWRPDQWEYRVRLRVASQVGLKSVTIHDGDRAVFRRWLPGGAKSFETEIVLANCQQLGLTPVVEDVAGRQAVGMAFWNRNLNMEEFYCSDRCNFLGNCRLRTRDGRQVWTQISFQANMGITPSKGRLNLQASPAVFLTIGSPTLPIDGAPAGYPTAVLRFNPSLPGELPSLFAYPQTYLVSPEISIGQADIKLGHDPAEKGAEKSPLGHPYQQPQHGWGNAWGGWHKLIPTRVVQGWTRMHACVWLPETFRIGWSEARLMMKDNVTPDPNRGVPVMSAGGKNWMLYQDGKVIATQKTPNARGRFRRGTFAALEDAGGSVVVIGMDERLEYRYWSGHLALEHHPREGQLRKGDTLHYTIGFAGAAGGTSLEKMVGFAHKFGIGQPGKAGYVPELVTGKQIDSYLAWRLDGGGTGIVAKLPKTDLPGFLPVIVEGLKDNWSVHLLDRARKWPNHRALPIRDGRAFAQLDLAEQDRDVFIGHPITADQPDVKVQVAWQEPGVWFVEAHNPTDQPVRTSLRSSPGWTVFDFGQTVELAPGSSRVWRPRTK